MNKPQNTNLLFKTFILLLLLAFSQQKLLAQISTIKAAITDNTGIPLTGNFLLTDTAGKTITTKGFNGSIEITGLNYNKLRLKLSSLFFADTSINILYNGNKEINLGTIVPNENTNTLGQVTITSSAPLMRYGNNGNLEVNVAGTILASSSSVNEILSRTPGVTISEGVISLQGKGEAIIYLNGVLVPAERLASIPTSRIAKIELISNPSAKYEAAGRAVINITTRTSDGAGLNGRLAQHLTTSSFAGTNANTFADLGYEKDKLSLSASLALLKGKSREVLYTTRVRPDPNEYLNSELTTDWQRDFKLYTTYGLGARYNISSRSNFSVSLSGNRDKLGGTVDSDNKIQTTTQTNLYGSNIARDETRNNNALTTDFTSTTDTLGSSISISTQYARYNTDYNEDIKESGGTIPRYLQNVFDQNLHITSFQADRSKSFSKNSRLETGIRFSTTGNNSSTQFSASEQHTGPFYPEQGLSSDFKYKETISAAYASFSAKAGKLGINLGVRGELTSYSLFTTAGKGQEFKKDYFNIFPNLQLELPISEKNKLIASYSSRITRPRYQSLNPFIIYQDPFTTIEGNPNLLPEKAKAIELAANLNKSELKLAYTYTTDQLSGAAVRGNTPESYVLKSINITSNKTLTLSLTRPFSIGNWWQSINTASITYTKSIDDYYDFAIVKTKPQAYFYSSNTFNLKHGIRLQLLAWYMGDRYTGLGGYNSKRSTVTAGIEKSLINNALKIGFSANDIFDKAILSGDYNVGKTQIYFNRNYGNKYFKLTASYNFGGSERAVTKNNKPVQSENSRAN